MLLGLRTWWLGAVGTPFLQLHITLASLSIGCLSGLFAAMVAILGSVRRIGRATVRSLLAGQVVIPVGTDPAVQRGQSHLRRTKSGQSPRMKIGTVPLKARAVARAVGDRADGCALGLVLGPADFRGSASGRVFCGRRPLVAGDADVGLAALEDGPDRSRRGRRSRQRGADGIAQCRRNPGRSTLTVGLVAAASFLIVAVSAFHVDPLEQTPDLHSGNSGFALLGESDQPIFQDLNSPEGRDALGFSPDDEKSLAGSTIFGLRVRPGDDASCLNLYQPRQPRMLGLPARFLNRDGFAWAEKPRDRANPWLLLNDDLGRDSDGVARIPVILEKTTANYSLRLWGGLGETFEIADSHGEPLRLQVVALLAESIFQSDLLVSETALLKRLPDISGYRFFLVETPPERTPLVRAALASQLGRLWVGHGNHRTTPGGFPRGAEHLSIDLPKPRRIGAPVGHVRPGGRAIAERAGASRRVGHPPRRGLPASTLAWLVLLNTPFCWARAYWSGCWRQCWQCCRSARTRRSIPWASLGVTLAAVLFAGLLAGALAVRAAVRVPVLDAICRDR